MLQTLKNSMPPAMKARLQPYYRKMFPLPLPRFTSEMGDAPKSLTFYTNLKCLAVCPHCCIIQDNPEVFHGNKFMTDEFFYETLDAPSSRDVKTLVFAGGEALQHPMLFDWCKEGQRRGMSVQVITNGMSMSQDKIVDQLLSESPFDNIQISLDAVDEEGYVAAKGLKKAPFKKICENVGRIANAYKSKPGVSVVTSYVVTGQNINRVPEMIELSASLNVDVVHFHTMQLASNEYWKRLGDSLFVFPPEYHAIMSRTDYPFTIQLQPPLQEEYLQNFCSSLQSHLVMGPEGTLAPCCHRAWGKQHGSFQTSPEPHNIPSRVDMRRKFLEAEAANDTNRLHESCKMCNRRLKGLFHFSPATRAWAFQPVSVTE
jgi:MoaA/NifB/PqqE/SkfB family radical SAM enzyme